MSTEKRPTYPYQLLDQIRRKPGVFIAYQHPSYLRTFMNGFLRALGENPERDDTDGPDFETFSQWIADKYGFTSASSGWDTMIEEQRENKTEALWLFFELLDEFRGIEGKVMYLLDYNDEYKLDETRYCRWMRKDGKAIREKKPRPATLTIQPVPPANDWLAIIARDEKGRILARAGGDDEKKVMDFALAFYGIKPQHWRKVIA